MCLRPGTMLPRSSTTTTITTIVARATSSLPWMSPAPPPATGTTRVRLPAPASSPCTHSSSRAEEAPILAGLTEVVAKVCHAVAAAELPTSQYSSTNNSSMLLLSGATAAVVADAAAKAVTSTSITVEVRRQEAKVRVVEWVVTERVVISAKVTNTSINRGINWKTHIGLANSRIRAAISTASRVAGRSLVEALATTTLVLMTATRDSHSSTMVVREEDRVVDGLAAETIIVVVILRLPIAVVAVDAKEEVMPTLPETNTAPTRKEVRRITARKASRKSLSTSSTSYASHTMRSLCRSCMPTKTTVTQASIRAPNSISSKRPVLETLLSTLGNSTKLRLPNASISFKRASCMVIAMRAQVLRPSSFRNLKTLSMVMKAREWSFRSSQSRTVGQLAPRTTEAMAGSIKTVKRNIKHCASPKKPSLISAKRETKETSSGSKARAAKCTERKRWKRNSAA